MNILQILPELNYGGVETGTVDLAKYLIKAHHKAVVVSAGGELVDKLKCLGAVHHCLAVNKKSLFSIARASFELVKIIRREDIQVVHARSRVPAWSAYFAARLANVPLVTTCHGYYSRHTLSRVMGWGKLVIVPSQIIGRRMIDDFAVPAERIRLIPRSVDAENFTFILPEEKSRTEFVIALIARITPIKGHLYFIKAIQRVYRSIPNIKVWIIGTAPKSKFHYKEDLEILVKRLGLAHIVEFLGQRNDIPKLFSKINLLVMASTTHEAFGRVVIEAQAAGVPVVATRVGGVVDIIEDGVDGLLCVPKDSAGMAEAIIRILRDNELSSLLAKNGRLKVLSKFSLERMAKATLEVYQEAVGSKRILVIKLSALGDLILSVPALKAIRKKYPSPHRITLLTGKAIAPVLSNCPYVDEVMVYDFKESDKGIFKLFRLGKELRRKNFDTAIDLQNNRKSHILCALSLASLRCGYQNKKFSFLLNRKVKEDKFILGPLEHQFRILNLLDIELKDKNIELWPSKEDERYIDDFLNSEWLSGSQILVGAHLSSSQKWLTKRWPLEYIAQMSEELALRDIRVALTGERIPQKELRVFNQLTKKSKPIIACGKTTINQLACLIKRCNVFISGDTAPLHIASGVGTPVIALFGPTDPRRHVSSEKDVLILKKGLECQPCYKPKCISIECMKQITVDEVKEAVLKLLNEGSQKLQIIINQ